MYVKHRRGDFCLNCVCDSIGLPLRYVVLDAPIQQLQSAPEQFRIKGAFTVSTFFFSGRVKKKEKAYFRVLENFTSVQCTDEGILGAEVSAFPLGGPSSLTAGPALFAAGATGKVRPLLGVTAAARRPPPRTLLRGRRASTGLRGDIDRGARSTPSQPADLSVST